MTVRVVPVPRSSRYTSVRDQLAQHGDEDVKAVRRHVDLGPRLGLGQIVPDELVDRGVIAEVVR